MQAHLGRKLKKGELIHHIDGDKANPEIHNLHLFDNGQVGHQAAHNSLERCAFELFKRGLITFNRNTGRYELADSVDQAA